MATVTALPEPTLRDTLEIRRVAAPAAMPRRHRAPKRTSTFGSAGVTRSIRNVVRDIIDLLTPQPNLAYTIPAAACMAGVLLMQKLAAYEIATTTDTWAQFAFRLPVHLWITAYAFYGMLVIYGNKGKMYYVDTE
jgi:hypothetical protein